LISTADFIACHKVVLTVCYSLCVAALSVDKTCCYFVELPVMTANWRLSEYFCAAFRLNRLVAAKQETKCFISFYLNFVTLIKFIIQLIFLRKALMTAG